LKEWLAARHRGLFIRSYVVLAGGLLVAAILLDLGFDALQSRQVRAADPWLESTFRLMESELASVSPGDRAAFAQSLWSKLDLELSVLDAEDISSAMPEEAGARELEGEDGKIYYLWNSQALHGALRLGSLRTAPRERRRAIPAGPFLCVHPADRRSCGFGLCYAICEFSPRLLRSSRLTTASRSTPLRARPSSPASRRISMTCRPRSASSSSPRKR
jgi:hypothetical protein